MLSVLSLSSGDLAGLPEIDRRIHESSATDPWLQNFFIGAYRDVFDHIRNLAPAIAIPYNCGAVIAAPNGRLVGIDLALLEDYYDGNDWEIPGWLYDLVSDRLDMLIVSHGHLDHCWVELIRAMRWKRKPVIVPEGIRPCRPKALPWGCWGVKEGTDFWWEGLHFGFHTSQHVYDSSGAHKVLTTRIWDGRNSYLHAADADTTNPHGFRWWDKYPIDVLLFKCGGVSPLHDDYAELEHTIDRLQPRKLILPMHLNEIGHRGTDAAMTFGRAYEHLARYAASGKLGDRRYAVLFGNRVVRT